MKCQYCNAQWQVDKAVENKLTNCPFCGKAFFEINNKCETIQAALQEIVAVAGIDILSDTKRTLSFFSDIAPHMSKERWLLENFLSCDGGNVFLTCKNGSSEEQKMKYLQVLNALQNERFIAEDAANRICEAVAYVIFGKYINKTENVVDKTVCAEKSTTSTLHDFCNIRKAIAKEANNAEKQNLPAMNSEKDFAKSLIQTFSERVDSRYLLSDQRVIPRFKYRNQSKTQVIIPDNVIRIEEGAFKGCKKLKKIHIPDSVTEIMKDAFCGCCSLEEIHLPKLQAVHSGTFESCWTLKEIIIPDGVKTIGKEAFKNCGCLEKVHIPDSVVSIGDYAFARCEHLKELVIPDSVKTIGSGAFEDCKWLLTKVSIPDSVTEIGQFAFLGCYYLKEVQLPKILDIRQGLFERCEALKDIIVPDGVKTIGSWAFRGCLCLSKVHLPDSITEIGDGAFSGCRSLYEIKIPETVEKIGKDAFAGCKNLQKVYISIKFSGELSSFLKNAGFPTVHFYESPKETLNLNTAKFV